MKKLLQLFLILCAVATFGCCLGLLGLSSPDTHTVAPTPQPPPEASETRSAHLGLALIPTSTPTSRARTYSWRVESLTPPEYHLGYGLGVPLAVSLERKHLDYGRKLHFRALGPTRFTYHAPPGCEADMRCIYAELMRSNAAPVHVLGERFLQHIRERQLNPVEATELITTFVQRIRYQQPDDQPFGVLPPALVPAQDRGDCDSKALLAVMLLRQVGIDAVILYSDPLSHAAVGVALPGRGPSFRHGSRSYRYVEITSEGWPLGMIPPQHDKPHLWKVLPVPELTDSVE